MSNNTFTRICALITLLLTTFTIHSNETKDWEYVITPESFNDVEMFFVSRKCLFYWPRAVLFNTKTSSISSDDKLKERFPAFAEIFSNEDEACNAQATPKEMKTLFGINLDSENAEVLLYFDAPFEPITGQIVAFTDSQREMIQSRRKLASKFNKLDKYLIKTPLTGIRRQKKQ